MKRHTLVVSSFLLVFSLSSSGFSADSKVTAEASSKKSWLSEAFGNFLGTSRDVSQLKTDSDTVLVTASRLPVFKNDQKEFTSNVSVRSESDLTARRPRSFQEAVKDLEGVHVFDQIGNGLDETFAIRGFPEGNEAIFLVDGVRMNEVDSSTSMLLPLLRMDNIESIEVARGSSSAIYGSGAFSGVVNITTRKPSEKPFTFFGGADWSSFGGVHFFDGVSGTIQDKLTGLGGAWNYYFNMGRDLNDGFRANGEWRDTSMDFKTGYELADGHGGIRFGLRTVQNALSSPGELTLEEYKKDDHQTIKPLDGRKAQQKILYINANKKFLDKRLDASLQASARRNTIRFLSTFRTFTDFTDGFNPDTNLVTTRSKEYNLIGQLAYQDEFGWIQTNSLAGAEITRGHAHDKRQDAFGGKVVERTAIENLRSGETTAFGIFGHEKVTLFDQLIAEFGLRGSFHWTAIQDYLRHSNDLNRHWRDLSITTGTVWGPVKWGQIFWNYSQAFRAPALSDLNSFGGDSAANLMPETAQSFEAGTRLSYQDIARVKFSYFDITTENEIAFDSSAVSQINQFGRNVNIGKTRRNGIELSGEWQAIREVLIRVTYTLTRAIIRKGVDDPATSFSPFTHRFLGQVPENKWTFGLESQPLKRLGAPYDGFKVLLTGIFVGRQHPQNFETASQSLLNSTGSWIKAYQVWDLKVSQEWKQFEVFLKVNNLLDNRYFSRGVIAESFGTATTPAGNYLFVTPAAPREFVLGCRYEFG